MRPARATALLAAAALTALLFPALSGSALLGFRDMLHNYWPMKALQWAAGPLPLWNDHAFGGSSILADLIQQPFYLPNVMFGLVRAPAWPGIAIYLWLHGLLGLWGAWLLGKRIAPEAAGLCAAAFALCGFTLANLSNLQWACAAAWVPWVLQAALRFGSEGGRAAGAELALFLPQPLLAGDPQLCLMLGLFAAALAVGASRRPLKRLALEGALVAALALVLLLPQLVATVRVLPLLERTSGLPRDQREQWSLHPARLFELFVPRLFGPLFEKGFWGGFTVSAPWKRNWVHSIYFSVLTPALLGLALVRRRRAALPWLCLALAALVLSLGENFVHFYGRLGDLIPPFRAFRYPQRLLALFVPGIAVLLALGAVELVRLPPRSRLLAALGSTALAAASLFVLTRFAPAPDLDSVSRSAIELVLAGGASALALLLLPEPLRLFGLGAVLVADLAAANGELLGLLPREPFRALPAACAALDQASGGAPRNSFRVFVDQDRLDVARPDWREQRLREYHQGKRNLLEGCGFLDAVALTSLDPAAERALWRSSPLSMLRGLGTRYVIAAPGAARAYGAHELVTNAEWGFAVSELPGNQPLLRPQSPAAHLAELTQSPGRIEFRASQAEPAVWTVSATLDQDWRAEIDGAPSKLERVESGVARAVLVPAGEHTVKLSYRPVLVLALFGFSLLLCLALALQASMRMPGAAI